MSEKKYVGYIQILLPAISVVLILLLYLFTNSAFIKCANVQCQKFDGSLVSQVKPSVKLSEASNNINALKEDIGKQTKSYADKNSAKTEIEGNLADANKQLREEQLKQANAVIANDNNSTVYEKNANALKMRVLVFTEEAKLAGNNTNTALGELKTKQDALKETVNNISSRYTKRLYWLFFSALVLVFTVIGIVISLKVLMLLPKEKSHWVSVAILLGFAFYIILVVLDLNYISLTESFYQTSLIDNGDISLRWLSITNSTVFPVIVFFAFAGGAIIYMSKNPNQTEFEELEYKKNIYEINNTLLSLENLEIVSPPITSPPITSPPITSPPITSPPDAIEDEKTTLNEKLIELKAALAERLKKPVDFQEILRNYSKMILYVGSVLIFAGLTRMKILGEWHQLFTAPEFTSGLASFFNSMVAVQGAFFSMLLTGLYLPMAYSIPPSQGTPDGISETFSEQGFFATIKAYAPRFVALMLPFVSGYLSDLFNFITDSQASGQTVQ
ncbi:MAG TPA: hypothetical protein PKY59_16580 [Pyrinomonadaceae bacterium]|nr:hypothetical protein [Pyrinomonadaceae bacterium]